jgi:hypothetical protein
MRDWVAKEAVRGRLTLKPFGRPKEYPYRWQVDRDTILSFTNSLRYIPDQAGLGNASRRSRSLASSGSFPEQWFFSASLRNFPSG